MPGNRWESSNQPLFIRTIWKDGHHHVIFHKDEETPTPTARSFRRQSTSRRSAKIMKSVEKSEFQVPSVKLFVANLKKYKSETPNKRWKTEERKIVKSAVTVDVIPSDSLRYNDLNKQVSFKNERKLKFTKKSTSFDVSNFSEDLTIQSPPPFSYENYCLETFNSSLSERVMIWLDLAIQNKNVELKKPTVINSIPQLKTNTENRRKCEGKKEVATTPLVTSRMECDLIDTIEYNKKTVNLRPDIVKRQLHIFLPVLPLKKCSESGSFVSSSLGVSSISCANFQS